MSKQIPLKAFYFMRHGETKGNALGLVSGQTDTHLNECGMQQANDAKKFFNASEIKIICTSPLSRASETAQILQTSIKETDGIEIPIKCYEGLKEKCRGELEGLTRQKVHELIDNDKDYETNAGGETREAFRDRVVDTFCTILNNEESPAVIISHSKIYKEFVNFLEIPKGPIENCEPYFFTPPTEDDLAWTMTLVGAHETMDN